MQRTKQRLKPRACFAAHLQIALSSHLLTTVRQLFARVVTYDNQSIPHDSIRQDSYYRIFLPHTSRYGLTSLSRPLYLEPP